MKIEDVIARALDEDFDGIDEIIAWIAKEITITAKRLALKCIENDIPLFDGIICEDDLWKDEGKQRKNKYPISQDTSGCYCFVETHENELIVLYAGKARKLTNRMQSHVMNSQWFGEWSEDRIEPFFCAYWICEDRAALESRLINTFDPLYNKRKE